MIPHEPLDALGMSLALGLDPFAAERDELVHIAPERLGVGVPEMRGDVAKDLGREVGHGRGALGG